MRQINAAAQVSDTLADLFAAIPPEVRWISGALIGVLVLVFAWWRIRQAWRALKTLAGKNSFADNLTIVAAGIATGVSAQGMWQFAGDVLHLWWPLRVVLFAFIEVAIITSAVRAKRSMRDNYSAGVDGIAVWALAALTAVLSSLDARSFGEAVLRLAAPLVAAWLWERGMAIERRRIRGTTGINWRITPERILVRLGIAEASERTAGDVDAQRRINRVSLAVMRLRDLQASGARPRKMARARTKLRAALARAVEHAHLASDPDRQSAMLDQIGALCSSDDLTVRRTPAPWSSLDHPAIRSSEADEAMQTLARWDANDARQRASFHAAATTFAERGLIPSLTPPPINLDVNGAINGRGPNGDGTARGARTSLTPPLSPSLTARGVNDDDKFGDMSPTVYELEQMLAAGASLTTSLTAIRPFGDVNEGVINDGERSTKAQVMRAYWDEMIAQKVYPTPSELARHADADVAQASRLRARWVDELSGWQKRRAQDALRGKSSS